MKFIERQKKIRLMDEILSDWGNDLSKVKFSFVYLNSYKYNCMIIFNPETCKINFYYTNFSHVIACARWDN